MELYLKETAFLDFNNPLFDNFLVAIDTQKSKKEIAVELYFLVRDSYIYDPYHLDLTKDGLKASNVILKKRSWCVEKALLLAACARKMHIPSRLGYAIVTNHIGIDKLTSVLRRNEIVFHGYVELFVEGKWIKCTPAFDERICKITHVQPLDWDGEQDSMFQEFEKGQRFMEYLHYYGDFDDVPIELMNSEMKKYYPHLFDNVFSTKEFSFKHL
ncbi:MAG: transglutaminase family protein [Flavobacteriia bacterium]|nr:transglutaminase family protein [Flavobacteriia bacterium]